MQCVYDVGSSMGAVCVRCGELHGCSVCTMWGAPWVQCVYDVGTSMSAVCVRCGELHGCSECMMWGAP